MYSQGSPHQGSAKIYQFPVGGRAALGSRDAGKPALDVAAARLGKTVSSKTVTSSSWYHEAAVTEDRTHKPQ
jgi:hypothetical protein